MVARSVELCVPLLFARFVRVETVVIALDSIDASAVIVSLDSTESELAVA